jgi:hypothetical protein
VNSETEPAPLEHTDSVLSLLALLQAFQLETLATQRRPSEGTAERRSVTPLPSIYADVFFWGSLLARLERHTTLLGA